MIIYIFPFVIMTMLGAVASLFFHKASGAGGFLQLLRNKNLYIGGSLYVISALMNVVLLRYLDYSLVLPLTSITYVWTMCLSGFILKEPISRRKILGVVCIVLGAILLSRG